MNDSILDKIKQGIEDMCYIWAKEIRATINDEGVLIFCILVPIFYPLIYSWAYNNEVTRDVPVAIVDYSKSQLSREFIHSIDASPNTKVAFLCNSIEEAKDLVKHQVVNGIIYLPENFDILINRGQQANVSVYCDMSLMLSYKSILESVQGVSTKMNTEIQLAHQSGMTDRDEAIATNPLVCEEVPIFNTTGGYGNSIIPGVLMLVLQQTLLLGIGLAAGTARETNRNKDLVPISKHYNGIFRIVLGKSMAYFMLYLVLGAYLTLVVPKLFGFTSIVEPKALIGLMIPYILACIFFGMALSGFVRYRENVMLLVIFTSVPLLFMSGISWPQSNIPGMWQGVSWLFPSTFGIRGYVRINTMGATLIDIKSEYQTLWMQVVIYFFTTCMVYRTKIIHARKKAVEQMERRQQKALKAKVGNLDNNG
ncbi:MAG: ABC transporter permease [Prevotella sp.]